MALESREGSKLVIRAELPGIDPKRDIEITLTRDVLHIRAYRAVGPEPRDHPSDLRYGSFVRDITLPPNTTEDQVEARYHDGILEVVAPLGSHVGVESARIPVEVD